MTKMILVLGAVLILFLPAARADGGGAIFDWTFNLTFVGDNACGTNGSGVGTSPCVETFNGSFETQSFSDPLTIVYVVGSGSVTTTGPLSGFVWCLAQIFMSHGVFEL